MGRYAHLLDDSGEIRYIAIHPGCTLEEYIGNFELDLEHFADMCHIPSDTVWEICRGTQDVNSSIATDLSRGTGIEASFWTNLREHYSQKIQEGMDLGYMTEYTYIPDFWRK